MNAAKEQPLQVVERVMSGVPEALRWEALAHLEQRARHQGWLAELRALREYRKAHQSTPRR